MAWADLLINALSGLGGAAIGAFATLRATRQAHRLEQEAAARVRAEEEVQLAIARAWRLTDVFGANTALIKGARSGVRRDLSKAPAALGRNSVWRYLSAGYVTGRCQRFDASDLLLLLDVGRADLVSELRMFEDGARHVCAVLERYSEVHTQIYNIYPHEIAAKLPLKDYLELDPRFSALVLSAAEVKDVVEMRYQQTRTLSKELIETLKPMHERLGLKIENLMTEDDENPEPKDNTPQR